MRASVAQATVRAPSGNGRDDLAERRSQRTQDESVYHALVVDAP